MSTSSGLFFSRNEMHDRRRDQRQLDELEDQLLDCRAWPVADAVALQIDLASFASTLSYRDRRLLRFLARGNTGEQAAARFNLAPGEVNELRDHWRRQWHAMHGEAVPA